VAASSGDGDTAVASASDPAPSEATATTPAAPPAESPAGSGDPLANVAINPQVMDYATKVFPKYDTNGDGFLVEDEWKLMSSSLQPVNADLDGDGKVSVREFALKLSKR
jgi:hypothetical protein